MAAYGRVDTLINNAGFSLASRFDTLDDLTLFEKVIQVNFFGSVYCTHYALPYLKETHGRLVAVSSLLGRFPLAAANGYSASKHAMVGFFDSLRYELIAAISSHDVEKMASLFTEDCFYEDVALGSAMRGREALKTGYSNLFATIADFKLELTSLFIAGNWVGSEWVMTGTLTPGKHFSIRDASISELQGGKVKRNSDYYCSFAEKSS